jgi:hypothetical protein
LVFPRTKSTREERPEIRFGGIGRRASAVRIHESQVIEGLTIAFVAGWFEPLERLRYFPSP